MANAYIVNKWRLWFRIIDINHRGEISRADVKDEEEMLADLNHLDARKKKDMQENLDRIWNEVVFRGKSGAINEDEFVEMNTKLFTADKAKFQEEIRHAYTKFFSDIVDINHEGSITEEEFVNMMRSSHHEDIALDKSFFGLYNPVNGRVPVQALIDTMVQFASCDDSSKRDIVKEGIENVV